MTTENDSEEALKSLPFASISESVLGKGYELSLVFCNNKKSKELNNTHREENKPTNVLSFPLTKASGEMFIDLQQVAREQKKFGRTFENLILFLFIHGLYHLEGHEHSSKMEVAEAYTRNVFSV